MIRGSALVVVAVACGGSDTGTAPPRQPAAQDAIAFVDATVLPMDRDTPLPRHTVVVRGDRIVAIGPTATTPVPAGARRIDARGKWLIPGLADMHVHTVDAEALALFVSMGVTTVRVMWGDAGVLGARDGVRRGEHPLAPVLYTAGEIVDGKPPIWPGSLGITTAQEGRETVQRQQRTGYDFVKVYSRMSDEVYRAIVEEAAVQKLPVVGHVPSAVGLAGVLAAKQRTIEHLDGYARHAERDDSPIKTASDFKTRVNSYKYADAAKLADAITRTRAAGAWNCPTLVVMDRISKLDNPDTARPEYRFVPPAMIESWDPKKDFRFMTSTAEDFAALRGMVAWNATIVKQLVDAGAPIVAGTDVGNPWLVPGFSLHDELALLVAAKLTPLQALRAATRGPAELLDATAEFGTIAAGRRADLVLLDADPLAQIENTRKIAGVVVRGRWYPAAELAAEREQIAAIYKGERSRFAGVAPIANATFTARYRASSQWANGEERLSAITRGGNVVIVGETRLSFDVPSRWELEILPDGTHRSLRYTHAGLDLAMVRDGERVRVTGKVGGDTIALDEALAADEQLGGAPLAVDAGFLRGLTRLEPDGTATIKLAVLDLRPVPGISRSTVVATRQPDATRTVAGKSIPVRVFRIAVGFSTSDVALDAAGWPVETATHVRVE